MGNYLNPGNDAFRMMVNDDIYVDKSGLIAFTNSRIGKNKRFICVSRPRRFGKSMTAAMLSAYYDKSCDSSELFERLEIAGDPSFREHLNHYDVIFLNIQQFLRKAGSPENLVPHMESRVLTELKKTYPERIDQDESSLPDALTDLYRTDTGSHRGFLFIIDEWDCIFRVEKENTAAQKAYLDFLRDLFKDRIYVRLAYLTGILPVKKYGTHSALNIFDEFSMTAPGKLAKYTGFTEKEVRALCRSFGIKFSEAKKWYDGYRFKEVKHIYNPKSIVDALTENDFRSYWTSTETYEALQVYIDLDLDGLREAVAIMLGGECFEVDTGSFQNDMTTFKSRDDVLTLLVHLGYLAYDASRKSVFIPNQEVREEFVRSVKSGKHKCFIATLDTLHD